MPPSNWSIWNAMTPGGSPIFWRQAPCDPMRPSPAGRFQAARGIPARPCGISMPRPTALPRTVCRIPPGRCRAEPLLGIRPVDRPVAQTGLHRQPDSIARRSRPVPPPSSRGTVAGRCRRPTTSPPTSRGRSPWPPPACHWDSRVCWPRGSTRRMCSMDWPTCGSTSRCRHPPSPPPPMTLVCHGSCSRGPRLKRYGWPVWCQDRSWRSVRPTRWRN